MSPQSYAETDLEVARRAASAIQTELDDVRAHPATANKEIRALVQYLWASHHEHEKRKT